MKNMDIYNAVRAVPPEALKPINAGRLKGMSDINPMWRIQRLTEFFGACGFGWAYEIVDKRIEVDEITKQKAAFVDINLFVKDPVEGWSKPIPGTGGSSFVSQEKNGAYLSDECFKMALTDAISIAAKALGVGADVWFAAGRSKYSQAEEAERATTRPTATPSGFVPKCAECGKEITDAEHDYSVKRFGKPLCRACQKKA